MSELEKFRVMLSRVSEAWSRLGEAGMYDIGLDMCDKKLVHEAKEAGAEIEKLFIEALHND